MSKLLSIVILALMLCLCAVVPTLFSIYSNKQLQHGMVKEGIVVVPRNMSLITEATSSAVSPLPLHAVIHVGPHKTSTTTLQQFLVNNSKDKNSTTIGFHGVLAEDNYFHPFIPAGQLWYKRTSSLAICMKNAQVQLPLWCRTTLSWFDSFVSNATELGANIVMSSEEFDRPDVDVHKIASYLVPHGYNNTNIVVTYRRFYDWIVSYHNQESKWGLIKGPNGEKTISFVEWLSDETIDKAKEQYTHAIFERYSQESSFNVSVLNMYLEDVDEKMTTVVNFFCNHVDGASHTCAKAKSEPTEHKNPSRVIQTPIIHEKIKVYYPNITLSPGQRKKIAAKLDSIEVLASKCLSDDMKQKLLSMSLQYERDLLPESWVQSEYGLETLMSDFEEKSETKFCSIDAEKIVLSTEWKEFLQGLPA